MICAENPERIAIHFRIKSLKHGSDNRFVRFVYDDGFFEVGEIGQGLFYRFIGKCYIFNFQVHFCASAINKHPHFSGQGFVFGYVHIVADNVIHFHDPICDKFKNLGFLVKGVCCNITHLIRTLA